MWLQTLAAELLITLGDATVWLSIGQGLLIGAACLLFGVWASRFVGLLGADAPAGEVLAVGLASGLLVLTSWWAAIMAGGRSAFTPVAIGFMVAIVLSATRRWRSPGDHVASAESAIDVDGARRRRDLLVAVVGAAVFVVVVALLYGSTLVQSPRDGVQPLEFMDEAYYSVLGAELAESGTETTFSPSGFDQIDGLPDQSWYHWGEAWLAAAAITILGTSPLDARHFVALPLILLAAAALTGTLVRRVTRSASRAPYLFGFFACLFLAPIPVIQAGHFSSWAVGMIFGITMYGLAAVAVLLSMYGLAMLSGRPPTWALAVFAGTAAALILPAHVVIAALAIIGVGSVCAMHIVRSLVVSRRLPSVTVVWRRTVAVTVAALAATAAWGFFTEHRLVGTGLSPGVLPFNDSWRDAIAIAVLGSGVLLAIALAWFMSRKEPTIESDLYVGIAVLLVAGALYWGARLGDFNTFHLFYGGLAIFVTPCAAIAVWSISARLRPTRYRRYAIALVVIAVVQIEAGIGLGTSRLQEFGPGALAPVSVETLAAIRSLPPDAKLAYACFETEENAFWNARLVSLSAHTGRPVIPMCFEADFFSRLLGIPLSADVPSPLFESAPQRILYPDSRARPSPALVAGFMKANGINYIYADAVHPNTLVPNALPVATSGDTQILRLP